MVSLTSFHIRLEIFPETARAIAKISRSGWPVCRSSGMLSLGLIYEVKAKDVDIVCPCPIVSA